MTCPVCKRQLAPTISICYTCGTMVQDSVREELATKIGRGSKPLAIEIVEDADRKMSSRPPEVVAYFESEPEPKPAVPNRPVIERAARPKADPTERISRHTSPTLVGFQNPRSNLPDWRLQLQNSIRQRKSDPEAEQQPLIPGLHTHLVTNGNTALKPQYVPEPEPVSASNPKLANALKRIEDSRRKFAGESTSPPTAAPTPPKSYPFNVVEGSGNGTAFAVKPATVNTLPKPRLVPTTSVTPRKGLDTNKLPPIAEVATIPAAPLPLAAELKKAEPVYEPVKIEIAATRPGIVIEPPTIEPEFEEVDDLAPLSTRFIAGLFDAIIAGFATAILMSPLLIWGGEWFSVSGVIAIAAAFGIVMFSYMTVGLGLRGRTLGMKIFSLEVIDIEENEYPTFHQAAVRSAVFLLSLPLLGIGFVPAFINEERRAAHDLVSGTILVREL